MSTTLVIGASSNSDRYANKAIRSLLMHKHHVVAISKSSGQESGIEFMKPLSPLNNIDTVTLYINPVLQQIYYNYIIDLKPRRVIFNPGTENDKFEQMLMDKGIEPVIACTLVLLSIGDY